MLRASSVLRILKKSYGVEPKRMIPSGHSEHTSVATNETKECKSLNRRTRIVVLPQLNPLFKLMERKK